MQLQKIVDPRDNLARASRDELWDFAKANGVVFEVGQAEATKPYMEKVLRGRGLTNIRPAVRFMGRPTGALYPPDGVTVEPAKIAVVDADADMLRQVKEQAAQKMTMQELRKEAKRRGIKMQRTDDMKTLRGKLESHPA